jgi:hypothetical protein
MHLAVPTSFLRRVLALSKARGFVPTNSVIMDVPWPSIQESCSSNCVMFSVYAYITLNSFSLHSCTYAIYFQQRIHTAELCSLRAALLLESCCQDCSYAAIYLYGPSPCTHTSLLLGSVSIEALLPCTNQTNGPGLSPYTVKDPFST